MHYKISIQNASKTARIPKRSLLQHWAKTTLMGLQTHAELTIRIVDETESALLNETYRHKLGPTNILSFPFEAPPELKLAVLGDLVVCAPLVLKEAQEQDKTYEAHWAHLIVHGILHLLGYDHINEHDANIMENLEIIILQKLNFPNPYEDENPLYE